MNNTEDFIEKSMKGMPQPFHLEAYNLPPNIDPMTGLFIPRLRGNINIGWHSPFHPDPKTESRYDLFWWIQDKFISFKNSLLKLKGS